MRKGWFEIPGVQIGDRALEQQLIGVPVEECARSAVLDLGSAEGLIARHLLENGAASVDCVECNEAACETARQVLAGYPARVFHHDLQKFAALDARLARCYDAVLLLSILHKLCNPMDVARWVVTKEPRIIVVRLPGVTGPSVVHKHTRQALGDIRDAISGYELETVEGPLGEWTGIFRRTSTRPST